MQKILEFVYFRLFYLIVYLLYRSYRITPHAEHFRGLAKQQHPKHAYLLTCWHEHLVAASMGQVGHPFHPLASRNSSGRLMGYVLAKFGFTPVWGSQNRGGRDKGGVEARAQLLQICEAGYPSAYTVDGSVGPRRKVKPGVVDLARKSGAAILPAAAVANRQWVFPTWDRLKLPKPFARVVVAYGEPIIVPPELSRDEFDAYLLKVEKGINAAEVAAAAQLEKLCGRPLALNVYS